VPGGAEIGDASSARRGGRRSSQAWHAACVHSRSVDLAFVAGHPIGGPEAPPTA
jgi:hypothetical protein